MFANNVIPVYGAGAGSTTFDRETRANTPVCPYEIGVTTINGGVTLVRIPQRNYFI